VKDYKLKKNQKESGKHVVVPLEGSKMEQHSIQ